MPSRRQADASRHPPPPLEPDILEVHDARAGAIRAPPSLLTRRRRDGVASCVPPRSALSHGHHIWKILLACSRAGLADHTPECVRLVASIASTVFTIVYALEKLNINTAWANKSRFTIHMLGAPPDSNPNIAYFYEAILHHVPDLKILNGGTILQRYVTKITKTMCAAKAPHSSDPTLPSQPTYSTTDPELWRRTIKLLVARRIPSVFTRHPNFDKVQGFHAPNAWFTGGFC
ncbi:hypothetical protein B0H19DRAFT_1385290 [Mycena capillaripes]|nr:hypothetical protein B0H19DRAFT_1385290 [Mycena capillaripes]